MEKHMFCFQCEQTAGCSACTGCAGVCGKQADTAVLQDRLTGALIGLARAAEGNEDRIHADTDRLVLEGLFAAMTNVNFSNDAIAALIPGRGGKKAPGSRLLFLRLCLRQKRRF